MAHSPSRPPMKYATISFASASIAVHVHVSPAASGAALVAATLFMLGVGEAPNLIDLNAIGLSVADAGIAESHACRASVNQEFRTRVLAGTHRPRNGADRLTFAEKMKDASAIRGRELAHEDPRPALSTRSIGSLQPQQSGLLPRQGSPRTCPQWAAAEKANPYPRL
jgi:hypothetical protein